MSAGWNETHGAILLDLAARLNRAGIRWFVLRGYQGLPWHNPSKDVDLMVEPGAVRQARGLLLEAFRAGGMQRFDAAVFGRIHCFWGVDPDRRRAIHIDLVEGYVSRGLEVFPFGELYRHVTDYHGLPVLDDRMNGMMLLVYKLFGYRHPKLKPAYRRQIRQAAQQDPQWFRQTLDRIAGAKLGGRLWALIRADRFDAVLALAPALSRALERYAWKTQPVKTALAVPAFWVQKADRILLRYRKYARTVAVVGPDGAGKTTFLEALAGEMNFYYRNDPEDGRFHLYHFRPGVLPNLGALGERAGLMRQDTDFARPHRSRPAGPLSSLGRIAYYTADYLLGWQLQVRRDVQYDRYSVFDRYSYDWLVDPLRSRLNLPRQVRRFFVALTPQPGLVFCLEADPDTIYARKQELPPAEIRRQGEEYRALAEEQPGRFVRLDARQTPEQLARAAASRLLARYMEPL